MKNNNTMEAKLKELEVQVQKLKEVLDQPKTKYIGQDQANDILPKNNKRIKRSIPKEKGFTLFLDNELRLKVKKTIGLYDIDKQDLIRAAIYHFLKNHTNEQGELNEEAMNTISEYIKKTTER